MELEEQIQEANMQPVIQKRGTALVEQHYERQQQQKESQALETIAALLPMLGQKVRILALQECKWDVDRAAALLRKFQTSASSELEQLAEERELKRQEQESLNKGTENIVLHKNGQLNNSKKQYDDSSDDAISLSRSTVNSSQSDMSVDSDIREKQRKKIESIKKHKDKSNKSKKDKKDKGLKKKQKEKEKKKKHKKDKKLKKDKRKQILDSLALNNQYGKFGIIRENDIFQKKREFYLWAMEVKELDIENLPKFEERSLFKDYMEDYNTSTLPNEKYYDLEAYEKRELAKQVKTGKSGLDNARLFIDDEAERRKEMQKYRQNIQQERLKEAYDSMQMTDKAKDMREQQMLRLQMNMAYKTGNMEKAQQISELLKPEDPKTKGQKKDRE